MLLGPLLVIHQDRSMRRHQQHTGVQQEAHQATPYKRACGNLLRQQATRQLSAGDWWIPCNSQRAIELKLSHLPRGTRKGANSESGSPRRLPSRSPELSQMPRALAQARRCQPHLGRPLPSLCTCVTHPLRSGDESRSAHASTRGPASRQRVLQLPLPAEDPRPRPYRHPLAGWLATWTMIAITRRLRRRLEPLQLLQRARPCPRRGALQHLKVSWARGFRSWGPPPAPPRSACRRWAGLVRST